jgi:hypothetical protein
MDLNAQPPAEWTTAEGPYELADHCVENKTNLLVLLNAWLDSGIQEDGDLIAERSEDGYEENGEEENNEEMTGPDWSTLDFWTARLWPLWRRQRGSTRTITSQSSESDEDEQDGDMRQTEDKDSHETIVVACNRTGEENGTLLPWLLQPICPDLNLYSQARSLQVPRPCLVCVVDLAAQSFFIPWGDARNVCEFGTCLYDIVLGFSFSLHLVLQ